MFYRIEKDRVEETSAENWESGQSGVAVLPTKSGKKKWTSVQLICSDSVRTTSIFLQVGKPCKLPVWNLSYSGKTGA